MHAKPSARLNTNTHTHTDACSACALDADGKLQCIATAPGYGRARAFDVTTGAWAFTGTLVVCAALLILLGLVHEIPSVL